MRRREEHKGKKDKKKKARTHAYRRGYLFTAYEGRQNRVLCVLQRAYDPLGATGHSSDWVCARRVHI